MRYLYHIAVQYARAGSSTTWDGMVVTFRPIEGVLHDQVVYDLSEKLQCEPNTLILDQCSLLSTSKDIPVLALLDHACIECKDYIRSPLAEHVREKAGLLADRVDPITHKRMLALANTMDRSKKVLDVIHRIIGCQSEVDLAPVRFQLQNS